MDENIKTEISGVLDEKNTRVCRLRENGRMERSRSGRTVSSGEDERVRWFVRFAVGSGRFAGDRFGRLERLERVGEDD